MPLPSNVSQASDLQGSTTATSSEQEPVEPIQRVPAAAQDPDRNSGVNTVAQPAPAGREVVTIKGLLTSNDFLLVFKGVKDHDTGATIASNTKYFEKLPESYCLATLRAENDINLPPEYKFALESGATISDNLPLAKYMACIPENTKILNSLKLDGQSVNDLPRFTVYYTRGPVPVVSVRDRIDENIARINNRAPLSNHSGQRAEFSSADAHALQSTLDASRTTLVATDPPAAGDQDSVYVSKLTESNWRTVFENNSLTLGVRSNGTAINLARLPAFKLLKGVKDFDTNNESPIFTIAGLNSEIRVTEITSEKTEKYQSFGFSDDSYSVAVSLGLCTLDASLTHNSQSQSENTRGNSTANIRRKLQGSHHFPQVRLCLDQHTLQLTDICKKSLDELLETANNAGNNSAEILKTKLKDFHMKFGTVFSTSKVLGGKLYFHREIEADAKASLTDEKERMEKDVSSAFGKSFASGATLVSAAGRGSYSRESTTENSTSTNSLTDSISWKATGGKDTFSANPSLWAPTVSNFNYWRVIQHEEPVALLDLISRIDSRYVKLYQRFKPTLQSKIESAPPKPAPKPAPKPVPAPPKIESAPPSPVISEPEQPYKTCTCPGPHRSRPGEHFWRCDKFEFFDSLLIPPRNVYGGA